MKEVYVVCQNFNTENVRVFAPTSGWTVDIAAMFDSEYEAFLECKKELNKDNVSIEKFVTTQGATKH